MAGDITGLSSMATRHLLAALSETYQRQSGCRVAINAMGGVDAARLVRAGTDADLVILASPVMAQLESEGCLVGGSRRDVATSTIAVAVRTGAAKPAIDDEALVKQAMLAARKIGFSTGPSGDHLKRLWSRWGISETMAARAVQAPAGVPVAQMLARGDVDLGFQQTSELMNVDGVVVVGPLPAKIQAVTVFTAGIVKPASKTEITRDFIAYMTSRETAGIKQRHGMESPN